MITFFYFFITKTAGSVHYGKEITPIINNISVSQLNSHASDTSVEDIQYENIFPSPTLTMMMMKIITSDMLIQM